MVKFDVDKCHESFFKKTRPILKFDESKDYDVWKESVRNKFTNLVGDMPDMVPPNIKIEWETDKDGYIEKRITFNSEEFVTVPCHLLVPKNAVRPCPVVICLQGHSTGMHISLGRPVYPGDDKTISGGDRDFALQIVKEGYAALVIEQRCFGERESEIEKEFNLRCHHTSMAALLAGRTMVGERVWDVSRAIDVLENFDEIDINRIACMGNSGGGTATFYAACTDERIKIAMPSCSVCTYADSIGAMHHCHCNYIPAAAKYFDMGELSCLIAPRPLVVVAGREDKIFPIDGVKEVYAVIEKIYEKEGAPDKCKLVIGDGGHRFYADPSWDVFRSLVNW